MDKNKIIGISIVSVLLIGIIYILNKEPKQEEIIKPTITKEIKEEIPFEEEEKEEVIVVKKEKVSKPQATIIDENYEYVTQDPKIEANKPKTIFKSNSKTSRYIVSLQANKTLKDSKSKRVRYVPLKGIIEHEDIKDKFSISLKDEYRRSPDVELSIQIILLNNDKVLTCDAYFLKNTELNYLYTLKIDIFNDSASCYILDEKKMPELIMDKKIEIKKENIPKEILDRIKQFEKQKKNN